MKKLLAFLLILLLACLIAFDASSFSATKEIFVEKVEEIEETGESAHEIAGVVTEITQDCLLIETTDMGAVLVQSDDETALDTGAEISAGDYITVLYDGMMSRSIPARITADAIRMYILTGKIISADPEINSVLLETETQGEVYATLPEPWLENTAETLKIYFDGAMTMSLPPRINAQYVISLG